jgi:hypothetical protein
MIVCPFIVKRHGYGIDIECVPKLISLRPISTHRVQMTAIHHWSVIYQPGYDLLLPIFLESMGRLVLCDLNLPYLLRAKA